MFKTEPCVFVFSILLLMSGSVPIRGDTFVGTNQPGAFTEFEFIIDGSVTNFSLAVSNSASAYSHLLLKAGAQPSPGDYDFAAVMDAGDNVLHIEMPDLQPTNYFVRVHTPDSSSTHAFRLRLDQNQDVPAIRTSSRPAAKQVTSLTAGELVPGEWHYFQVGIDGNLPGWIIHLNSQNSVDLYLRRGALPTLSTSERSSLGRPLDTIFYTEAEALAGSYYLGVHVPTTASEGATYVLQTASGSLQSISWDPGTTHSGTLAHTNSSGEAGNFYFRIHTEASTVGAWRTALEVISGEAEVSLSRGLLPAQGVQQYASNLPGSDGFVLHATEFEPGEEWFILVKAEPGAEWRLWSGDVFVQNLGALATDESSGSGPVPIGPEGIRFFRTTIPVNTLAWRLGVQGAQNNILVKKNFVPHPLTTSWPTPPAHDLKQPAQMLVVPDYLVPGNEMYFVGVEGAPGEVITLDSRQQPVTDLAFTATTNLVVSGGGYVTFRIQVPVQQVGWQVNLSPDSGDANLSVRRNLVPNEWRNDALSDAQGLVADSIALGPPVLSDGVFYVTVYGSGDYTATLTTGEAQVTDINYVDTRINDEPNRVGWKFYRVANVQQQAGTLGWELELANHVPGTEIAIRRNSIPYRRNFRTDESGYLQTQGDVDASSNEGFLQDPAHQADVWYVGIYNPGEPFGEFTLTTRELGPEELPLDGGSASRADVPANRWQFFRVDVPNDVAGWDIRLAEVTSGQPQLVVRRGQLPVSLDTRSETGGPWFSPGASREWPISAQWAPGLDWTAYPYLADGGFAFGRVLAVGVGNPLEPGTYFAGIRGGDESPISFVLQSRAIGAARSIALADLNYAGGSHTNLGLSVRSAAYYRVIVPTNRESWQIRLQVTSGEALLMVQKDSLPNVEPSSPSVWNFTGGFKMQRQGNEHFLLLPESGQTNIPAGSYYLAVVSEGDMPDGSLGRSGAGDASYVITSVGSAPIVNLGTVGGAELLLTNILESGQIRACQFTVPAGIAAVELQLTNRIGNPVLAVVPGSILPQAAMLWASIFDDYGSQGGNTISRKEGAGSVTLANPSGMYSVVIKANSNDYWEHPAAECILHIRPVDAEGLAFDGGSVTVTNQTPGTWRYFRVDVPAAPLGWDLRLKDVANCSPKITVRRARLPDAFITSSGWEWPEWYYGPRPATNWPAGYQVAAYRDWTLRNMPTNGWTEEFGRVLTLSMRNPLEPGVYYVGILNESGTEEGAYTLVSRGIGTGFVLPVVDLAFVGGSITNHSLLPREVNFYHVSIPTNTTSWQVKLTALAGESLLAVQEAALPHIEADMSGPLGLAPSYGGRRMQKTGNEHFVLLPPENESTIPPGDYYLAVVSEGVVSEYNRIGEGASDMLLTSVGPLAIDNLGTLTSTPVSRPGNLEGGQLRAYQFEVPAGAASVEIRLDDLVGNPYMAVRPGADMPYRVYWENTSQLDHYGVAGGQISERQEDAELITLANPEPGIYSLIVKSKSLDFFGNNYVDSSYTLVVQVSGTPELAFDGGNITVADQPPGSWRFYRVEVPANTVGWDVRLTDVANGRPRLTVRRDALPDATGNFSWQNFSAYSFTNWPSGNQLGADLDWTHREYSATGNIEERGRVLAVGMGNPLEPGVYFVGVYNDHQTEPSSYQLLSRGIGTGMSIAVIDLPFAGGSITNLALAPRDASYYRITVPQGAASWRVKLETLAGESLLAVQEKALPSVALDSFGYNNVYYPPRNFWQAGGRLMRKAGNEHFALFAEEGSNSIPAGVYYLAVVGEGVNPADDWHIGTGSSSYVLHSLGPVPVVSLGSTAAGPLGHTNSLEGGEVALYAFTLAPGSQALETRLADRNGNPVMSLRPGEQFGYHYDHWGFNVLGYYGVDGGYRTGLTGDRISLTLPNPAAGSYRLLVKARSTDDEKTFPDAGYTLQVRSVPVPELNFTGEFNTNGLSNTAGTLLGDAQRAFYRVVVPETVDGQPVIGWRLDLSVTQGRASVRVRPDALPAENTPGTTSFAESCVVIVPPFFHPGTWFVEVKAEGTTEFSIASRNLVLERSAWTMPAPGQPVTTPGLVAPRFGDSGVDASGQLLPGDHGIYLEDGKYHFYAITVPTNNGSLLHVTLEAISGNPDVYARVGAAPTLTHDRNGSNSQDLIDWALNGLATEYGAWVPGYGQKENRLAPGTWFLAVRAGGNSNARYRLRLSVGNVQDLPLAGGAFTAQSLSAGDWGYYRVFVPANSPAQWNVSFTQQSGEVELCIRDTVPPGSKAWLDWWVPVRDWQYDRKNQGPYPQFLAQGTHTFEMPPIRPGHVYYLGFRARNDAMFSVSSGVNGATLSLPAINFYTGALSTNLPPHAATLYCVPVPMDAARWRHSSVHNDAVQVYLEQGTLPRFDQTHWRSYGADSWLNQYLLNPDGWPWRPGETYFLCVTNTSDSAQPFSISMEGRTLATDDEDQDELPDAWETQYFGNWWRLSRTDDPDGDGLPNWREYQLNTNPTNGLTRGRFDALESSAAGIALRFLSEPGQRYEIQISSNLTLWTPYQVLVNTNGVLWIRDGATNAMPRFYRSALAP